MTTMNKPFRLETVLELAQKDTEKATQEVGRLMNTREAATQKLALLSDYRSNYHQQLLANANAGGDNVHRGALLGALFGLINGQEEQDWFAELVDSADIAGEWELLAQE